MVGLYGAGEAAGPDWSLPEPLDLGEFLAPVEDWRELANAAGTVDAELA